ncbi:MAG: AMP-binding protein, partial [Alphaproteobacteria bacterium]
MTGIFDTHLGENQANHAPLSPLYFLERAAAVHTDRVAVVHGDERRSWAETHRRCLRLASALARRGVGPGDTVAVMAPNVPAAFEAHFSVPMTGAVLNALNIRLDAHIIAFILDHGEAKVLITDRAFSPVVSAAMAKLSRSILIIDIDDPLAEGGELLGETTYEDFLEEGDPDYAWSPPADEWQAISLNYTSGTTGNPKGVVYHHRGAYLNALGNAVAWHMPAHPVDLWTLPIFHCNGWCFPWTVTALAGTNVFLRDVEADPILAAIETHDVTHFCGAPIVLNMVVNTLTSRDAKIERGVAVMTAGAAPPSAVLEAAAEVGLDVTHVYGLTETYGPGVICDWHEEWNDRPADEQANLKARQGVRYPTLEGLMVADPATMDPVAADGAEMGEIMFRGNTVMKGYLKNPTATDEAFAGGWFRSGDLAVVHPDGYM